MLNSRSSCSAKSMPPARAGSFVIDFGAGPGEIAALVTLYRDALGPPYLGRCRGMGLRKLLTKTSRELFYSRRAGSGTVAQRRIWSKRAQMLA
jgi:hypothetical protein